MDRARGGGTPGTPQADADGVPAAVGDPLDTVAERALVRRAQRRRRAVRIVGLVLVAYGLAGLGLLGITAAAVGGSLGDVTRLTASMEGQRQSLIRALDTTARTLDDAGSGLGRLDGSLARAHASTTQAAGLSRGVAETMRQLGAAMNVDILGAQPFIGLAGSFDRAAAQLDDLGSTIDGVGAALDANSADIQVTRGDLGELRTQVDGMARTLQDGPRLEVPTATVDGVRLLLFGLMAWLGLLSLGITVLGAALIVRSQGPAPRR